MRVLVDIVHPAHAHFFRPLVEALDTEGGNEFRVVSRDKDVTIELLDYWGIPHTPVGAAGEKTLLGQFSELMGRDRALWKIVRSFRPDAIVTRSPAGVQVARLTRTLGIFDTDDGKEVGLHYWAAGPFAQIITTPDILTKDDFGRKHRRYRGYKALAYLHPNRFTPDPAVRDELGVDDDRYFIVRLTALQASHDRHETGLSPSTQRALVAALGQRGRVLISSEGDLPEDLADLGFTLHPARFHDALAFADMVVGDSQTVAAEAALLGTPSLRASSFTGRLDYLNDLEHAHGLVRSFRPDEERAFIAAVEEVADDPGAKTDWLARRDRMLEQKDDVAAWYLRLLHELVEERAR